MKLCIWKFREILKSSRNSDTTLKFTDIYKSCTSREFLASQISLFNAIRENKIITKISGSTVFLLLQRVKTYLLSLRKSKSKYRLLAYLATICSN